jgi:hypothetical protein
MCLDIAFYSALQLIDDYFPDLVHDGEINFDPDMGMHFLALGHNRYPVITCEQGRYHRKHFESPSPASTSTGRSGVGRTRSPTIYN